MNTGLGSCCDLIVFFGITSRLPGQSFSVVKWKNSSGIGREATVDDACYPLEDE